MKYKFILLISSFLLLLSSTEGNKLFGQNTKNKSPASLNLQNRVVSLNESPEALHLATQSASVSNPVLIFLQFSPITKSGTNAQSLRLSKEAYMGAYTFLYCVSSPVEKEMWVTLGITAWAPVEKEDKISLLLKNKRLPPDKPVHLLIQLSKNYEESQLNLLINKSKALSPKYQPWKNQNMIRIQIPFSAVSQWAAAPFVLFIQPEFKPQKLNVMAEGYTNTEIAHQPLNLGGYHLLGTGVTVGIGDDANPHHIDYIDRLRSFNPSAGNDHGNHTTGTVGGNGIVDQRYRGFAPETNLISDFYSQIIANAAVYSDNFDMIATNNSYALIVGDCNYAGIYDAYSVYLDQQAFDLPHLLNCFAAGNDGALSCSPFPTSYGTVVGAYSTAKNVLTVGAIGLTRDIEYYKFSRGPVKDGRIKPEVTAMGYKLTSTGPNNGYKVNSGTSMSTPNVTGGSALLYQRYRQLHGNQDPDNSLIKLILMNGADDIAEPGPDYHYGFGLMNIGRSLKMLDSNRYFSGSLPSGQQESFSFQIPSNTAVAKVMLYWNDPASSPMAAQALVNDLDLTVKNSSNNSFQPLVLNPSPSQVATPATEGEDHTNNVEQVTLNNPVSGTYTIDINGYNIPQGPQNYYVAYSFIPKGIAFQYPYGGEALNAGDSNYVYWQAEDGTQPFTLSLSTDNGANWQVLENNISAGKRAYYWHIASNIHSGNCLLKITRGSESATNKAFTITARPEVMIAPAATQCPGSIRFSWHPVIGATSYQVFKKSGIDMKATGNTSDTTFTITGLSTDSIYWFAVAAIINNKTGIRSVAQSFQPNQGNCSAITQHGDLRLSKILLPKNGRKFTLSALSANATFKVKIQNTDNQPSSSFKISWQLDNSSWQSQNFIYQLGAASSYPFTLPDLNLSTPGNYPLKVAITNLSTPDPVPGNDTLNLVVRQLPNNPIDLSQNYMDGFESFPDFSETGDTVMGVGNSSHWDFEADHNKGRLRSFVNSGITISGSRSVSLDNAINQDGAIDKSSQNYFTGNFNLSNYDTNNAEIRCSFDYLMSGFPKFDTGNQVWIRGNEAAPWQPFYKFKIDSNNLGALFSSGSLSISDVLSRAGQNFSTATQIRFCQRDTSQIESAYYGNGLTMDNFSLYLVHNDIQLLALDSILHFNCALSNQVPLKIKVYNSVQNTVYNIPVTYVLDNNPPVTEIIDSISGKDTVQYAFQTKMDLSATTQHSLSAWCAAPNDSYHLNDSILNFIIHNQPVISNFPYLQDFEGSNGYFYTEGANNSWAYGTPNSPKVKYAASGSKAWKTNLTGTYNDNELSYLYSPCFDISNLQNPTLSFSMLSDIETNPTDSSLYDQAYLEYTTDGINWQRLGAAGAGYNWYNNAVANAWTKEGESWWHVATLPLPQTQGTISFRFVLKSDPGSTYEGLAIDDIHVYDLQNPIYTGDSLPAALSKNVPAGDTVNYLENNQLLATIINPGILLNNTTVQRFSHQDFINFDSSQYFLPENFVIKSDNSPGDSVELHLYVLGDAMKLIRNDISCPSCASINEIYRMGISQYSDEDKFKENSSLKDNTTGQWNYIPWQKIRYIPYDKGYEAKVKVSKFSEIWFNSGGPDGNATLNQRLFDFQAKHLGSRRASLIWHSQTDVNTTNYFVQRADSNLNFQTIGEMAATHQNGHSYIFLDTPLLYHSFVLYRILYQNVNGNLYSSPIRRLDWSGESGNIWLYPNPVHNGVFYLAWFKGNDEPLKWQLFDNSGKLLHTGQTSGNGFNDMEVISIGKWGLASGIYLLRVVTKDNTQTFKVVYQR